MIRDLVHNIKAVLAWAGATIATNTDTDSAVIIDTQGFQSAAFLVPSGTLTDGTYALKVLESDSATFADGGAEVGGYQVQDSFAATDDNKVKKVGPKFKKRYLKLRVTSTGTTTGGIFTQAIAVLGNPVSAPVP
jgi:hypothetical protein